MIRVVSIGECMVEMIQEKDGRYRRSYAGDTFNMAQYLAWIGADHNISVSYLTVLGRDIFGRHMLSSWEKEGIDISLVMSTDQKNTGLYFADINERGNRDYTFFRSDSAAKLLFQMRHSEAIFDKALEADLIYVSAITLMILSEKDREKLVDFIKRARMNGVSIAFDTNYRASGWKHKDEAAFWINYILPFCNYAFPTYDENHEMYGDYRPQDTLNRIRKLGVQEIIVKCGGEKCIILDGESQVEVPAHQGIKVIDTTSAGDSFNAGYLCARLNSESAYNSALWGHTLAAEVIQHRGALIGRDKLPHLKLSSKTSLKIVNQS